MALYLITNWIYDMNNSPLAIILIIAGVMLCGFGIMATDSLASAFSKLFTGNPSDKSIFLIIAGVVSLAFGLVMMVRARRA